MYKQNVIRPCAGENHLDIFLGSAQRSERGLKSSSLRPLGPFLHEVTEESLKLVRVLGSRRELLDNRFLLRASGLGRGSVRLSVLASWLASGPG